MRAALTPYDELRGRLAVITTPQEARSVEGDAERLKTALLLSNDVEGANHYAEIVIDAARVVGQFLGVDAKPGRPPDNSPRGENLQIPSASATRYRNLARLPDDSVEAYKASCLDDHEIMSKRGLLTFSASGIGAGFNNRGDIEYYTPIEYTDAARRVFGGKIDLDPASCLEANTKYVKAAKFYTKDDDGLAQPWKGAIWCNPPYGGGAQAFCEKGLAAYQDGTIKAAIFLLNGHSNGSAWFYPLWDFPLCFTSSRIKFHVPEDSPPADAGPTANSIIVYMGADADLFRDEFNDLGFVVRRY